MRALVSFWGRDRQGRLEGAVLLEHGADRPPRRTIPVALGRSYKGPPPVAGGVYEATLQQPQGCRVAFATDLRPQRAEIERVSRSSGGFGYLEERVRPLKNWSGFDARRLLSEEANSALDARNRAAENAAYNRSRAVEAALKEEFGAEPSPAFGQPQTTSREIEGLALEVTHALLPCGVEVVKASTPQVEWTWEAEIRRLPGIENRYADEREQLHEVQDLAALVAAIGSPTDIEVGEQVHRVQFPNGMHAWIYSAMVVELPGEWEVLPPKCDGRHAVGARPTKTVRGRFTPNGLDKGIELDLAFGLEIKFDPTSPSPEGAQRRVLAPRCATLPGGALLATEEARAQALAFLREEEDEEQLPALLALSALQAFGLESWQSQLEALAIAPESLRLHAAHRHEVSGHTYVSDDERGTRNFVHTWDEVGFLVPGRWKDSPMIGGTELCLVALKEGTSPEEIGAIERFDLWAEVILRRAGIALDAAEIARTRLERDFGPLPAIQRESMLSSIEQRFAAARARVASL